MTDFFIRVPDNVREIIKPVLLDNSISMPSPRSKKKDSAISVVSASSSSSLAGSCFSRFCSRSRRRAVRVGIPSSEPRLRARGQEGFASARTASSGGEEQSTPRPGLRAQPMEVYLSNYMKGALRWVSGESHSQRKRGREVNEDSCLLETRILPSGLRVSLIGVFDGHGNEQLSHWLSDHFADVFFRIFSVFEQAFGLPNMLDYICKLFPSEDSFRARSKRLAALHCSDLVTMSLCASLAVCEEQAMNLDHVDTAHGGSCATVVAITNAGFFVAKAGDCSAALISGGPYPTGVILRTSDHRTSNRPDEVSRVLSLGGSVYKGNAVGMAFSSINVTRSLGDTLWRANEDWKRDMTKDASSNQRAIDESLAQFSRDKGCVGVSSEPEWYSCCCQGGRSQGQQVVHWAISSNSPPEYNTANSAKLFKASSSATSLKFFLILGSDGFWETQAFPAILQSIESAAPNSAKNLALLASQVIGLSPHDDSTVIVAELIIDMDELQDDSCLTERRRAGSSDGDTLFGKRGSAMSVKRRTTGGNEPDPHGSLDYLFK